VTYREPARTTTRRIRIRRIRVAGLLVVIAAIAAGLGYRSLASSSSTAASPIDVLRSEHRGALGEALPSTVWPAHGQAAVQIGQSQVQAGPNQHAAAIASVAKVMTAYLVLRDHPLRPGQDGPTITLTDADVADTDRRRRRQESVVSIAAGEQLTERQALQALLLPSANNIAAVLARWDAGSADRFVARMNATGRSLGMTHTRYTDPSGYDDATVSTAADQVRIVDRAMRLPVFASIVATPSATLPVAGTVHNTNTLLGHNGFVGVKTGSTAAAGGCFAFRAIRWIDGKRTKITGVVLGQPGHNQIAAGLAAADAMVDRIASQRLSPEWPAQRPAEPGAPGDRGRGTGRLAERGITTGATRGFVECETPEQICLANELERSLREEARRCGRYGQRVLDGLLGGETSSKIAVAAGVSITTVSRTMRRLRDTVVELGYRKPA
jgi:D-alanyl-D-alanine carboxypeptidase (penicillin-binding protein 5/6)